MFHKTRWTLEKIEQRLKLIEPLVYRQQVEIKPFHHLKLDDPSVDPPVGLAVDNSDWPVIEPNTYWGTWMTDYVLRTEFQVPVGWGLDRSAVLYLPLGEAGDFSHPEALAYIDGVPHAACDRHHQEILLPEQYCDGKPHRLTLHLWTGLGGFRAGLPATKLFMQACTVAEIDQPTRNFITTARVALETAKCLDDNDPAKGSLLNALDAAFRQLDIREPLGEAFYASLAQAGKILNTEIPKAGPPLDATVVASGHAHIDVAWLWTLGQTRRKAGRTFHTVLRLMEQFSDYHFTQSQPQLYDYVKQDYPELFQAIKTLIAAGRWEPIGGMWVEADCNLSGAESLARQFLLGRTFFREHFGPEAESPVLWLPDVFGYAWALPQLIKQAGLEYFFTIKIGWSQYNRLPYDSFWWQGLDGTRVLTHFSTTPEIGSPYASTYNARATPEQAIGTWRNFQQKESQNRLLMAYGFGDGGGGPTREMLENIREMAAFPALPQMHQGSVIDFFRRLEADSGPDLPTWNGELYLELHRGTYTTQSRNKRANRQCEFLLHDAEFLAAWAAFLDNGYHYPAQRLRQAWALICLNQFHDIIPGSSIAPVYDESLQQYAEVRELGNSVRDEALAVIAKRVGGDLVMVNPTSFARDDLAFWEGGTLTGQHFQLTDGTFIPTQSTEDGLWMAAEGLAPYSCTALTIYPGEAAAPQTGLSVTPDSLENDYLRVELDRAGDITRLYDKANRREVLPEGMLLNQFQAFEDRPLNWDAWDIDIFYDDKMWSADPASSVAVIEAGPLRATLEVKRRILNSDFVQRISLTYNSPRLDIETTIDWQERHILLKVAFPVDILAPQATYEVQWGNVQRPTHRNTSWDWARFETCAQKWVDLSEGNYGVSLLNDCKYGHDIQDNVMRLSLLRGPTLPDPQADLGEHQFSYSLLPHAGAWNESTVRAAYALNDPLIVASGPKAMGDLPAEASSLVAVDRPNIVVETVKQAEDGRGVIVRLYDNQRHRGPVTLTAGFDLAAVWRTNLIEEDQIDLPASGNQVSLMVKPFGIVTLRLIPA